MNYYHDERGVPAAPDSIVADLKILNAYNDTLPIPLLCYWDSTQSSFFGETSTPISNSDTLDVIVTCYDFGAHGNILMEAYSDSSNWWYGLTKFTERDSQVVNFSTIPRDEDGSSKDKLADHWEELMLLNPHCPDTINSIEQIELTQDMDDYIHGVLLCDLGDYLTAFEEYRGFHCRALHTRTSPWEKDFFIYSDLDSTSLNTGIGYAWRIGPKLCHFISDSEMYNFSIPSKQHYVFSNDRAVNWLNDRIDSSRICPSAILLNSYVFDSTSQNIGMTYFFKDLGYVIPETTVVGYIFTRQIRFYSYPNYDTLIVDLPVDSLVQLTTAGHEIGHMVNMKHNLIDTSIMFSPLINWINPPSDYTQRDLDFFLVKPRH